MKPAVPNPQALRFLRNLQMVPRALKLGRFRELADFAELVEGDAPVELLQINPDLYWEIHELVTKAIICGYGNMSPILLRRLSDRWEGIPPHRIPKRELTLSDEAGQP